MSTINQCPANYISTVSLPDNDINSSVVIPGTNTFGTFFVLVSDTVNTGASAIFAISGKHNGSGSVNRIVSTAGNNAEHLTVSWASNEQPKLQFLNIPNNGNGSNINYRVRVQRTLL